MTMRLYLRKKRTLNLVMTNYKSPEGLPDLCNEFYGEFLVPNNFFGFYGNDIDEFIEIIQHFCAWLFKNEYTKSKLTLAN